MKKKSVSFFLLLLSTICFSQPEQLMKPKINTVGFGSVSAFPNAAQITIGFHHVKPTLRDAVDENQKTADEVLKIVQQFAEDSNDIKMSMIETGKATKWDSKRDIEVFIGFESSQKLVFVLKNLDKMKDFTEALLKTKFYKIERVSYFNTNAAEYIKQAQELAVIDAIETTKRLARASNVKTGNIIFLQNNKSPNDPSNTQRNYYEFNSFRKGMGGRGVASRGEIIVYDVSVTVQTEII
jgi:uncharacterized protein